MAHWSPRGKKTDKESPNFVKMCMLPLDLPLKFFYQFSQTLRSGIETCNAYRMSEDIILVLGIS